MKSCSPKRIQKTKYDCVVDQTKHSKGKLLGCGEQGCAYFLTKNRVIKESKLSDAKKETQWTQEACLGQLFGQLMIAPIIYDFYLCNQHGYIVMDTLQDAKTVCGSDQKVRTRKTNGDLQDNIGLIADKWQMQFMECLAKMIQHDYIHMDNHIGNLGYIKNRAIVFDFGFTQHRTWSSDLDKIIALAFSLFQILEHCPRKDMDSSGFIWRCATTLLLESNKFNASRLWNEVMTKTFSPSSLYKLKKLETYSESFSLQYLKSKYKHQANSDLYIGLDAYAYVLPRKGLYDQPLYETIYHVRTGTKF